MADKWLTIEEVAAHYRIGVPQMRRRIKARNAPPYVPAPPGGKSLWSQQTIDEWDAKMRESATHDPQP